MKTYIQNFRFVYKNIKFKTNQRYVRATENEDIDIDLGSQGKVIPPTTALLF